MEWSYRALNFFTEKTVQISWCCSSKVFLAHLLDFCDTLLFGELFLFISCVFSFRYLLNVFVFCIFNNNYQSTRPWAMSQQGDNRNFCFQEYQLVQRHWFKITFKAKDFPFDITPTFLGRQKNRSPPVIC